MLKAEINRSRTIGMEFEFFMPKMGTGSGDAVQSTLASILSVNGRPASARSYNHSPVPSGNDLVVECDSSISGTWAWNGVPYAPIELKTRIITYDDFERIVPKVLNIINDLGGKVNHTCGFHIHLGIPEVSEKPAVIRSLFNLFYRFEPVIFGLLAPSRTDNSYCRAIVPNSWNLFQKGNSSKAYVQAINRLHNKNGLNLSHIVSGDRFACNPRIELRYHQGTLDFDKVSNWLRFCLQMIEHACTRNCQCSADQIGNDRIGLERLLVSVGMKPNNGIYKEVCPELRETGKFLISRWKNFNGDVSLQLCKSANKKKPVSA